MTKIGVIGATGNAGSSIFEEARERGHDVTALVRNQEKAETMFGDDIQIIQKDAFDLIQRDLDHFDVVVNAFATDPEQAYMHVELAKNLVSLSKKMEEGPRLFFILGAGSLLDENEQLFVETIRQAPNSEEFIAVPENQLKQLNFLKTVNDANWVGISPGAEFEEGKATESKTGRNYILKNSAGESVTSSGTLATAILDEIERPQFENERFTVINA